MDNMFSTNTILTQLQVGVLNNDCHLRDIYDIEEVYMLCTRTPNDDEYQLVLQDNALPKVITWPPCGYYKYKGKFIPHPRYWTNPEYWFRANRELNTSQIDPTQTSS